MNKGYGKLLEGTTVAFVYDETLNNHQHVAYDTDSCCFYMYQLDQNSWKSKNEIEGFMKGQASDITDLSISMFGNEMVDQKADYTEMRFNKSQKPKVVVGKILKLH